MNINLANIDFCPGGKSATLTETTAEILLSETEKVIVPPEGTDGFNKVTITHAPVEESVSATITENGTHTITPSTGFGAMSGVNVDVKVPNSGYTIGGPEWFRDMTSKYQFFDRSNYGFPQYMIIDNKKFTIGKCDDNSVPKLDSNGNQITDSNGNIVYEKFVPMYTQDPSTSYGEFIGEIFTDNITNLPWSTASYFSTNEYSTVDIRWPDGNRYTVRPVFFPIATTPLDTSNEFILGADHCVAMLNFTGTGTHNDPIQIVMTDYMNPIKLRNDQGSICNQNGVEFGGWMMLTKGSRPIDYFDNDHPILKNKNVTEINLIISSSYIATYSGFSGIPRFVTNIKSVEMPTPLIQKNMRYMFAELPYLTNIPYLNTEGVTDMYGLFMSCSALTTIPQLDTHSATDMGQMLVDCASIISVPKLDATSLTDAQYMFGYSSRPMKKFTTFGGLTNLKIDLDLSTCPALTKESLLNVFNEAADVTASPKTLTLGTTNLNKLTAEEKAIATNKGWTLK